MKKLVSLLLTFVMVISIFAMSCTSISAWTIRTSLPNSKDSGWKYYSSPLNTFSVSPHNKGNCTWYAFGRAYEVFGKDPGLRSAGDAGKWYSYAKNNGFSVGSTPKAGSIICWSTHVAFVESVSGSTITWTESNYQYPDDPYKTPFKKYSSTHPETYCSEGGGVLQGYIYLDGAQPTEKPGKPYPTSKSLYPYGENVTLSWEPALYATNYWLDFYKDGTKIDGRSVSSPLVLSSLEPGKYSAYITATNVLGQTTSDACNFEVFNSAPGKPYPTPSKSAYLYGETVTLNWNAATHATNYWLDFYKDGVKIDGRSVSSPLVLSDLKPGKYEAYVTATNTFGNNTSEVCIFEVVDSAPAKPHLTSNKSEYPYGESVTLSWNSVLYATNYWLDFYKDDVKMDGRSASNPLVLTDLQPGKYEVFITATNPFGQNTSEVCSFAVFNSAPGKPYVTSSKSEYSYGEDVTLTWDKPMYSNNYWLDFYKDGVKIDARSVENPLVLTDLETGKYEAYITANNLFGHTTSDVCIFEVKDKEVISPDKILGDVDGDKRISIKDATAIQKHVANLIVIDEEKFMCADTDKDNKITVKDATRIQKFLAAFISEL